MGLIKTRSTSLLALAALGLLVAGGARAQEGNGQLLQQSSSSSKAQKLEWPRTFSGQPDFAFTRDEALLEARTRSEKENEPLPLSPSLQQLVNDDSTLDPLGVNAPKKDVSSTDPSDTTVTDPSDTQPMNGQSLMERLMAQSVALPTVAAVAAPDLTEFKARLNATITQTVANWQPQSGRYNFDAVIHGLVLQAIVTSPLKYAVINQQRYAEGETFRISVPMSVPDDILATALRAQMPVSGTLPASLQASYDDAYQNALGTFNAKRAQTPEIGQQTLILPVRVVAIMPRQVQLDLNGQPYTLSIRYAY